MHIYIFGVLMIALAYIMGSFSSAIVVCRLMGLPDPRTEGSNNPGATNVLRIGGKKAAAIVLLVDVLKGTLPVLISQVLGLSILIQAWVALAATAGHVFPSFYHFNGGKGVATGVGVYIGLNPLLGAIGGVIWLVSVIFCQYSSLSSLLMMSSLPVVAVLYYGQAWLLLPLGLLTVMVIYKHQGNIMRLKSGTESKTKLFSR